MIALIAAALMAWCGCSLWAPPVEPRGGSELETAFRSSERSARESRTLSDLAALEKSLDDYVRHEGRIPERLEDLIPKYAAEIPPVDPAAGGHPVSQGVTYYPSSVIRDGAIDAAQLKDTGRWGYAFNPHQVIVFVDCTHADSHGRPWYRERGVF